MTSGISLRTLTVGVATILTVSILIAACEKAPERVSESVTENAPIASADKAQTSPPMSAITGKVKWSNDAKGYGFITPDDGTEDVFVHYSAIEMQGFKTLKEGQRVRFLVRAGAKCKEASNVQPVQNP